ncbi:methyltransferase family protein [Natrialba sp. SSL1]|uniref:methyltransferase family protein n=1 Tax=Natrialba sp. SSL1 TaxID=1869245 RepID=UPI0008F8B008|nr:isoprenylcysteine carboxylmethyltransferase family protein [Natrialba sp. SSL1]OIB59218.1 protein-S-isoprenylcysteine methyltransferase [Natrialba sp. SSL1]
MAQPLALLKTAVFTVLVPGTVAGLIPWLLGRTDLEYDVLESPAVQRLGQLSLLSGVLLYLHTAFQFADSDGTPSPSDEPDELVTDGVYAYSRNPMYIGVVLVVVGQAVRYRSALVGWWAVGCLLGFHRRVVSYEEPHLAAEHGETFDAYTDRVPRWLPLPRVLRRVVD